MAVPGKSALRSFLHLPLIRIPLGIALGLVALGIGLFAIFAACNAVDDTLSADAKAMLVPPAMGSLEDGNGFVAFVGMVAPASEDQMAWGRKAAAAFAAQAQPGFAEDDAWKEATRAHIHAGGPKSPAGAPKRARGLACIPEARDCLAEARRDGAAVAGKLAEGENPLLLARYRKVREAAKFSDLYNGANPVAKLPSYSVLNEAASLVLIASSEKLQAGDLEAVVAELEQEVAFHRRVIADGRHIVTVMVGNNLLARDLLTVSELLRSGGEGVAPFRARLAALAGPEIGASALAPAYRLLAHEAVSFGQGIRGMFRDNRGWLLSDELTGSVLRNWTMSLFAQPNGTSNRIAAAARIQAAIATVPAAQFDRASREIAVAAEAPLARPWYAEVRNPVGKGVSEMVLPAFNDYAARMHDLEALGRMVRLQATLAERGITDGAAIAAFVAGEGAQLHPDPYSGRAFEFDPGKRLLSFEPRAKAGWRAALKKRYGKVGIAL